MSSLPIKIEHLSNYSRLYVWNHPELGIEHREPELKTLDRETADRVLLKCESCGLNGFSGQVETKFRSWRFPRCETETYMKKCSRAFLWCSICKRFEELAVEGLEVPVLQLESLPPCLNPDCGKNLLSVVFLFDKDF